MARSPSARGAPARRTLTVGDSSFIGNRAGRGGDGGSTSNNGGVGGRGGAMEIQGGSAAISATTFSGNIAGDGGDGGTAPPLPNPGGDGGDGGAIYVAVATMTIATSTFASNRAGVGGITGADSGAPARGGTGGAWFADSSATASAAYTTFSGNLRGPNAVAFGANGLAGGRAEASILADPAPACQGATAGPLRNVALPGDPSCPGPRLDGDPRLGPLAANGGPTLTLAPGPGSAAIDALAGAACPATDQRGLPRPQLGGCDAGAVEVQPPPAGAAGAPRTTAAATARRISALRLSPSSFRAAGAGGSIGALTKALQQRRPIGTTVRYTLDGAAKVTFTITKPDRRAQEGRPLRQARRRPARRQALRPHRSCSRAASPTGASPARTPSASPAACAARPWRWGAIAWWPGCRGRPPGGGPSPPRPSASSADRAHRRANIGGRSRGIPQAAHALIQGEPVKVRASVKPICEKCRVIKRHGKVLVICTNARHKQVQG